MNKLSTIIANAAALIAVTCFAPTTTTALEADKPLYGEPDPSNPRHADFDYLRGEWETSIRLIGPDGSRRPLQNKSHVTAYYHQDGRTVQSCFRAPGFYSTSIRAYDANAGVWKAHFLNAQAGRWSGFTSRKVGDTRETIVPGGYSGKEDFDVKAIEYDITPNSYKADIFRRAKGSSDWVQTYEMRYQKLADLPTGPKC